MFSIFYYVKPYANICDTLNKAVENFWSLDSLCDEIYDSIIKSSNEYLTPKDNETCVRIDYDEYGTGEGEIKTTVKGYSYGFSPIMVSKKDLNKDDLITKAMLVGGVLITGFILGKRSNKLRPLKKRERFVDPNFLWRSYPDISYETRNAIKDEVIDFIWAFMQKNDLHFAKGRK